MSINLARPEAGIRPQGLGYLECTDMFCGAGGSSLGLEHVPGILVTQCINHDKLAIEAHNNNFPHADHDYQDIWDTPAARFRRTPLLWCSPSCTHHAYCRGAKSENEEADRSRATMWCCVRFTEHHRYDAVIVENVVEARLWCRNKSHEKIVNGKIKGCSCGEEFDRWYHSMLELGYEGQIVFFNSQFALPTPQSRDRMYVVFWRKGARKPNLNFAPASWCSSCEKIVAGEQTWKPASKGSLRSHIFEWGRYGANYFYSCPDCREMVAPAVVGAKSIIDFSNLGVQIGERAKHGMPDLKPKTRKRIKVGLENLQSTKPITVQVGGNLYERKGYARVWSIEAPMRTITTTNYTALCVPNKSGSVPSSVEQPAHAVTGRQHLGVVVRVGGQNGKGRTLGEPMQTVIGSDRQVALVVPNREHTTGRGVDEALPAVTTAPMQHMLVQVNRGAKNGRDDSAHRTQSLEQPHPAVNGHGEVGIVSLRGEYGMAETAKLPTPTVVGSGNHHGLLVYNGNPGFVRSLEDSAGTVTARDKQSLLVPYYTVGVARDTEIPMGAISTKERHALVVSEDDIDACWFRMLKWPELLKAQYMHMLPDGTPYRLEAKRQNARGKWVDLSDELRVRMIGNAVSSPVAAMIGASVVEALS